MTQNFNDPEWTHTSAVAGPLLRPIGKEDKKTPKSTREDLERRFRTMIDKDGRPFTIKVLHEDK